MFVSVLVCICVCEGMYLCVWVRELQFKRCWHFLVGRSGYVTHLKLTGSVFVCVCVCVCVCVWCALVLAPVNKVGINYAGISWLLLSLHPFTSPPVPYPHTHTRTTHTHTPTHTHTQTHTHTHCTHTHTNQHTHTPTNTHTHRTTHTHTLKQ